MGRVGREGSEGRVVKGGVGREGSEGERVEGGRYGEMGRGRGGERVGVRGD